MSGYTKLFNSILASTVWRSSDKTRLVWITMMAMADRYGTVEASLPGLADLARVSIKDCQLALVELSSPDEFSRSKESEGRRIEEVDGGWRLINHLKYRNKMGGDERREYLKMKQREYRARLRQQLSTNVNNVSDTNTQLTHAEAEAEATPDTEEDLRSINKLVRRGSPHTTSKPKRPPAPLRPPNGNGPSTARSKRPIFAGQRLTVFEWMLDDCAQTLGPLTDAFDLHAWFYALDAELATTAVVIPKRDGGVWLQEQLVAEAQRRGLPIAVATPPPSKRSAQLAHMVATIAREEAERRQTERREDERREAEK